MARVLGVGIATLDLIFEVDHHPAADEEMRALAFHRRRGGNATNTLVVLSGLGHRCSWAGLLPSDEAADFVADDLARHGISLHAVERTEEGALPISCVLLDRRSGARTIVHHRDLPEYSADAFARLTPSHYDWIHFEGRAVEELARMLPKAAARVPCSLEIEKPRSGIEALFRHPRLLLFSRGYARARGFDDGAAFLAEAAPSGKTCYLAWGSGGGWCREADGRIHFQPAPKVEVVDSLGAGDVFNAAVVHGTLQGWTAPRVLAFAVRLASAKCARMGLEGLERRSERFFDAEGAI